jgi:type IV pilus assembly protein PilO
VQVRDLTVDLPAPLQNFIDGPKLPKVILGLVGVIAIGAVSYFLLLAPTWARIDDLKKKQAAATAEVNQVRAQVAEIDRFRREIAELEKRLDALKERLPSEKETPTLYRALSTAADEAGLGVALFQPKAALPKDVVSEIPIILSAEGSYHQLAKFFSRVASLPRVVNVQDFKLTGLPKSKNSMKADLTLATYMYRAAPPPPAARPGAPVPKPAAALPSAGARS